MANVTSKVCDYRIDPKTGARCGKPVPGDKPTKVRMDNVPTPEGENGAMGFEIDMCGEHRQLMIDTLLPFMQSTAAIQVKVAERLRAAFMGTGSNVVTTRMVRKWWEKHQDRVSAKYTAAGPLPDEVPEAYLEWQREQEANHN